jgi:hypothetical protein
MLIDTLRIRLVDDKGTPQAGEQIVWTILQGSGAITPLSATTDASGVAEARWRLGQTSGINQVEVSSPDDSTVVFETVGEAFRVDLLDSNYGAACGLTSGDLWCWGEHALVNGEPVSLPRPPFTFPFGAPALLAQGQGFTDLAVGWLGVCALSPAGRVECFASGGPNNPAIPAMRQIAGSDNDSYCGVALADSSAWCWNLLGSGAAAGQVAAAPTFRSLEMESGLGEAVTACGLAGDSTAYCWGAGPLGDGTFNSSATPVAVSGGHKFVELAVGDNFSCGLELDGDVWCWGRNEDLQLGSAGPDSPVPIFVTDGVSRIAAAITTAIAIRFGTVVRWGNFGVDYGTGHPPTPLASVAGLPVIGFSANDTSCLMLVDGQAYCFDELFIGSTTIDIDLYNPVQPVVLP